VPARRPTPHAVVLAGGAGERFWPASRGDRPKYFLDVGDGQTLLDAALARARAAAGPERTWVVCGEAHRRRIRRATGLPAARILAEPARRNTAMAVAWAAHRIGARDPEAVLVVIPADHRIPDRRAFAAAVRRAAAAAADAEVLVTLGVRPTRPDTGYGYIRVGAPASPRHRGLRRVRRFVEKPDARRARAMLRRGGHLWNAGIFVWKARTLLEEIEAHAPALHRALLPLRRAGRRIRRADVAAAYRRAPALPVDVAVMERSRRVWTLPVSFRWSDVGTWESLAAELGVEPGRSRALGADLCFDDAGGNLVWGSGRVVALLGVRDTAVIDTGDALLVARLDRSPELRRVVAALKRRGREDVT